MRPNKRISVGTVLMLTLSGIVLAGFFALLPSLSGGASIRVNASELVVALDSSVSQLSSTLFSSKSNNSRPAPTVPTKTEHTSNPTVTVSPIPKRRFTLCAGGSISLDAKTQKYFTSSETVNYEMLTDQVKGLAKADVSIAALSNNVLTAEKASNANLPSVEALQAFRNMGFNTMYLGWTGILDNGLTGAVETRDTVRNEGFSVYGVSSTRQERNYCLMVNVNDLSIAFLSYQGELSSAGKKKTSEDERTFCIGSSDTVILLDEISSAKAQGADIVIVSLCWGKKGAAEPTEAQKTMAQTLANGGADILLGVNPGVLQSIEILTAERNDGRYHPVLCAYSLGALFSSNRDTALQLGSALLNAEIIYDPATDCIAFTNMTCIPLYTGKGKENKLTVCRVLWNDGKNYPDFLENGQKNTMEKCLKRTSELLTDSPISLNTAD